MFNRVVIYFVNWINSANVWINKKNIHNIFDTLAAMAFSVLNNIATFLKFGTKT